MSTQGELPIFKQIPINPLTKSQLLHQLIESRIQFNEYAHRLFAHPSFTPSEKAETVTLVKAKLSDLGITSPSPFQKIAASASNLGLKLCPLYLAAFLRLEYLDQPEGPYLTVASAPPENDEDYPSGFYLRNFNNALWLRGYRATGETDWPADNEFIFLKSSPPETP